MNNKDIVYNETQNTLPMDGNVGMNTVRCESQPNPEGQGEICLRGCEGLDTFAGVAISARDISVGEIISDDPP